MLIEVIGRIKGKEIIVDRLEPDTRFNIVIKIGQVKKRAIALVGRAVL